MSYVDVPRERLPFRPVCGVIPGYPWDDEHFVSVQEAFTNVLMHNEHPGQCFFPICDMLAVTPESDEQDERVLWTLAAYVALGLDPRKAVVYRESDVPELFEMAFLISKLADVRTGPDVPLIAAGIVGVRATALLHGGRRPDIVEEARTVARAVYRRLDFPLTSLDWIRPHAAVEMNLQLEDLHRRVPRLLERPQRLQNALRDGARSARVEVASVLRRLKSRMGLSTKGQDVEDRDFVQRYDRIDWVDLVAQQRRHGRSAVTGELRELARKMHKEASVFAARYSDASVRDVADLVSRIVYPFAREHADGVLTYYSYGDGAILDWYVQRGPAGILGQLGHSLAGARLLLEGQRTFEVRTLEEGAPFGTAKVPVDRLPDRITILDALLADVTALCGAIAHPVVTTQVPASLALDDVVRQAGLALQVFCPVPQTEFHDEVLFLCTVQVSELLFWAMRQSISAAVTADEPLEAEAFVRIANGCAGLLYKTFLVLRTMPKEFFADFRDYTGRASAVQSRGYQVFDILYRGADEKKLPHLAELDHLRDLVSWGHPALRSLAAFLRDAPDPVVAAARELDATLLQWRGLHLAFAKTYLPPGVVGTGGTSGAEYLRKFLRAGLFDELGRSLQELDIDADEWDTIGGLWISPPDRLAGSVLPPGTS
jgi:tryptophan 2,3-dioxygenase